MTRFTLIRNALKFVLVALLSTSAIAQADTIFGIYAGAGTWQQEYSGNMITGVIDIDVENDLGIEDDNNNVLYLALEHPIPVLPNLRLQYVSIDTNANSTLSRSIDFNGVIFPVSDTVATQVDLAQTDLVLYYELLDNVVSLDVGIAARYLDGSFDLASSTQSSAGEFTGVIPMLYGKFRVDLPFTGAWLAVEGQGIGYQGSSLIDATALVGWESPIGLGVEVGWRSYQLELDDVDDFSELKLDVSGIYAAVNFHL